VNLDALGPARSIPASAFRLVHRHIGGVHAVVDHCPFCDRLPFPGLRHLGDQEFLAADARDDRAPSSGVAKSGCV